MNSHKLPTYVYVNPKSLYNSKAALEQDEKEIAVKYSLEELLVAAGISKKKLLSYFLQSNLEKKHIAESVWHDDYLNKILRPVERNSVWPYIFFHSKSNPPFVKKIDRSDSKFLTDLGYSFIISSEYFLDDALKKRCTKLWTIMSSPSCSSYLKSALLKKYYASLLVLNCIIDVKEDALELSTYPVKQSFSDLTNAEIFYQLTNYFINIKDAASEFYCLQQGVIAGNENCLKLLSTSVHGDQFDNLLFCVNHLSNFNFDEKKQQDYCDYFFNLAYVNLQGESVKQWEKVEKNWAYFRTELAKKDSVSKTVSEQKLEQKPENKNFTQTEKRILATTKILYKHFQTYSMFNLKEFIYEKNELDDCLVDSNPTLQLYSHVEENPTSEISLAFRLASMIERFQKLSSRASKNLFEQQEPLVTKKNPLFVSGMDFVIDILNKYPQTVSLLKLFQYKFLQGVWAALPENTHAEVIKNIEEAVVIDNTASTNAIDLDADYVAPLRLNV